MTALMDPAARGPRFRSADAALAAERDGYAIVPVLGGDDIATLESIYWGQVAQESDGPLAIDYLRPDRQAMDDIRSLVQPLLEDRLARIFEDHRIVFTTFVVKHPGPGSEMFLHEDRTWVDERRYRSGTMWIPLVDVGPDIPNGGLQVVPGSHRLATYWSGSLTPDEIRPYDGWLRERLITPSIPAGSGLVYDSRLLHASLPNLTEQPRIALVCGMVPRDAQLIHVRATGTTQRSLHAVDEEFFVRFGPREAEAGIPADYPVIEEVEEQGSLSPDRVAALLGTGEAPEPAPVVPDDLTAPGAGWSRLEPGATSAPGASPGDQEPAELPRWIEPAGPVAATTAPAGLAVHLAPGARAVLHRDPEQPLTVAVVDAPPVAAGIAGADAAANVRPGDSYRLGAGAWTVWNDGPGDLLVVLGETAPAETDAPADTKTDAAATPSAPPVRRDRAELREQYRFRLAGVRGARPLAALLAAMIGRNNRLIDRVDGHRPNPQPLDDLAWYRELQRRHPAIRAEWDRFEASGGQIPLLDDLFGGPQGNEGSWWRLLPLMHRTRGVSPMADPFPETVAALAAIPHIQSANWSVMGPGGRLPDHSDSNAGALRLLVGVDCGDDAVLRLGGVDLPLRDGEAILFDDTAVHGSANRNPDRRVLLMCDLVRDLPGRRAYVRNWVVQNLHHYLIPAFRRSPRRSAAAFRELNGGR